MAIAFDVGSNSGEKTLATSITWSHTCTGTDMLIFVGVGADDTGNSNDTLPSGITYAGVTMTLQTNTVAFGRSRVTTWYLAKPATGANNVVVTFPAACTFSLAGAMSLTGVDPTNPVDASNTATGNGTTASVAVTTVRNNCWVLDTMFKSTTLGNPAVGAGQTAGWDVEGGNHDYGGSYEGPKTPAGSVTMSWSWATFSLDWIIGAVSFRPFLPMSWYQQQFPTFQKSIPIPYQTS